MHYVPDECLVNWPITTAWCVVSREGHKQGRTREIMRRIPGMLPRPVWWKGAG